jgi:CBS domain-containing protein
MYARDVMAINVITVLPTASVRDVATLLLKHHISALPVVDPQGSLVGIISEGDLVRRAELNTDSRRSWWLDLLSGRTNERLALEYVKSHARKVEDVMTRDVVTAKPSTPLRDIAALLEKKGIKRVPIVEDGKLVGIVSRANLIQALASSLQDDKQTAASDSVIRQKLMAKFESEQWSKHSTLNATVAAGTVQLWGFVGSDAEKEAARVAAELIPGVRAIENNIVVRPIVAGL